MEDNHKDKVIHLVDYLIQIALLRTRTTRDVDEYQNVLWLKDIPKLKGCFTQAWGRDEDFDSDVWIEIQNQNEPPLPGVPAVCKDWIEEASLRDKNDIPDLRPEITKQVKNSGWQEESDQPEFISHIERLEDHSDVQDAWDKYVEEYWLSWMEAHKDWESIHRVYAKLFAIHQEQLRFGEEYELVLALGLLTWQTPNGQRVRRHLIVANAVLEFEAKLGKFTVRTLSDGANVRPELDMLDAEEQPERAEEIAKASLSKAGNDDPWNKGCVEGVLQALVHSIDSKGEYFSELQATNNPSSDKPIVEYAPALILRKRSVRGLTETLKQIRAKIQDGEDIPSQFKDLAEIQTNSDGASKHESGKTNSDFDGELFFPKPWNEEQHRIVDKIRTTSGVLVQGPPGTGKSHTIANLICHLLATGQRTLITAKTPRALQVLEELVPEELHPLCINLLGSGPKEGRSLESSVGGILRQNEDWDKDRAASEIKKLDQRLHDLRKEKAKVNRRLRDIRESETHSQSVGLYRGPAARIAKSVNQDRSVYSWFTDTVPLDKMCPISSDELRDLLRQLLHFGSEKRQELDLVWPDELLSADQFAELVESEQRARREYELSSNKGNEQDADALSSIAADSIRTIQDSLTAFSDLRRQLSTSPYLWIGNALRDVASGNESLWHERHRVTQAAIDAIEPRLSVARKTKIIFFSTWICSFRVRSGLKEAWAVWEGCEEQGQGPYTLQFQALKDMCSALDRALSLGKRRDDCNESLRQCPALRTLDWNDEAQIDQLIASCRFASKQLAEREILKIEEPIGSLAGRADAHFVVSDLLQAIRNRDIEGYKQVENAIQSLKDECQRVRKLDADIEKLRQFVPNLTAELEQSYTESYWDERVQQIGDAWHWAQARFWIDEYIRKEDAPSLAIRSRQIEDEINKVIAQLAELHAWSFCLSRLESSHRSHMIAWQQAMRRLGKGTGRHAPKHRRDAQQHLNKCREAVPAWVMPLHRVWDTVDPAPGIFDVVIIDEASQCGLEALPLFYLGKKVLIVGDDKQISPDAVGLPRDAVYRLINDFLSDFDFKDSFDVQSSVFDHGKRLYGEGHITLREHFRCMPEIIRFSNDLCYPDTPLIPLRQYGPDRLNPLERIFIESGYREGSMNRVVNRPEVDAIVEKIVELCDDERYSGKTMGVVVLQGEAQAGLIERQLLERLGAEEMERRRLVCGNSYSFQGDERDVMFLSMVAAPNERIGPLTSSADERRFNVAASRARDQMFLFHSVTVNDLSASDLRRRLLEFFKNTKPQEIAGMDREELERRAAQDNRKVIKPLDPFDSWFEVDVALELARRGYRIQPQVEFAGRWIDLVIEGGQARLAVECDGDQWHGLDHYEKDMDRQRQLERCGWEFFRVRESAFYANREFALAKLWSMLEERGIFPSSASGGSNAKKAKVMEREKASTKPPFELTEPPNNRQKPRVDDGQGVFKFTQRRDTTASESSRSETEKDDSWNKKKYDMEGKVWWKPKGELGELDALWILVPDGVKIETQQQYLNYLGSRIQVLVDELAQDPEGYTGHKDVQRALESIVKRYVEDKIPYPTEISAHPTTWVETIMYYLEDSMEYFTLLGEATEERGYERVGKTGKLDKREQEMVERDDLAKVLVELMQAV